MRVIIIDTETFPTQPGLQAPPYVCMQWGRLTREPIEPRIELAGDRARDLLAPWLAEPSTHLVGHNIAFDMAVLMAAHPELAPLIFRAYTERRISCTQQRERLIALSRGELGRLSGKGKGKGFSMEALFLRRFEEDISADKGEDSWRLRYGELYGVPVENWPEDARRYALKDIERTARLWIAQIQDAAEIRGFLMSRGYQHTPGSAGLHQPWGVAPDPWVQNEHDKAATAFAWQLRRCWGYRTDGEAVEQLEHKIEVKVQEHTAPLLAAGLAKMEKGRAVVKQEPIEAAVIAAWQRLGQSPELTDKGNVKADKYVLEKLGVFDPLLEHLRLKNKFETYRKYVFGKKKDKGEIRYSGLRLGIARPLQPYGNALVDTGRTSTSGELPDQQLPKRNDELGVRRCAVPRPGWVFFGCDYDAAELGSQAQNCLDLFGASRMAELIKTSTDLHYYMAAEMDGVPFQQYARRGPEGWEGIHPEAKKTRKGAKAVNFGLWGGMGAETFVRTARNMYGVHIGGEGATPGQAIAEAKRLTLVWKRAFPEAQRYLDWVGAQGDSFRLVQMVSLRVRGNCGYTDGANSLFQGRTADGATLAWFFAMMECYTGTSPLWDPRWLEFIQVALTVDVDGDSRPGSRVEGAIMIGGASPLYGTRMIAFVHDELLGSAPEYRAHEAAERLADLMMAAMRVYLPDVPSSGSPYLMRRWLPGADTMRGTDGRLIPCEETDE